MTKKGKIATGIVAGVVVLGGIGALTDKDDVPSTPDTITTAIIETAKTEGITAITTKVSTTEITVTSTAATITTVTESYTETKTEAVVTEPPVQTVAKTQENHFNDYDNSEQQNTKEYVLNTARLKVHKPSCNDVKKIAPENYSTTTDLDWAKSQGYTACGHCHPF